MIHNNQLPGFSKLRKLKCRHTTYFENEVLSFLWFTILNNIVVLLLFETFMCSFFSATFPNKPSSLLKWTTDDQILCLILRTRQDWWPTNMTWQRLGYGYTRTEVINTASEYAAFFGKRPSCKPFSMRWFYNFMGRWQQQLKVVRPSNEPDVPTFYKNIV